MSRGAVAIKAKGVLAGWRSVAANNSARASHAAIAQSDDGNLAMTWLGGLDQPAGDHGGRGKIRAKQPDEAAGEVLVHPRQHRHKLIDIIINLDNALTIIEAMYPPHILL